MEKAPSMYEMEGASSGLAAPGPASYLAFPEPRAFRQGQVLALDTGFPSFLRVPRLPPG